MDRVKQIANEISETKEWPKFSSGDTITVTYKIKLLTVLLVFNSILFHTIRCKYHIQYLNYQKYNYHAHITVYTPL